MDYDEVDVFAEMSLSKGKTKSKQLRFEQKVLLALLRKLEAKPGEAKHALDALGDEFNLGWLRSHYSDFPVDLMAYKLPKPVTLVELLKRPLKTSAYQQYLEAIDNFSEEASLGLVFASDGDGLDELVMHNVDVVMPYSKSWSATLQQTDAIAGSRLYLHPLDGFAQAVADRYSWRFVMD